MQGLYELSQLALLTEINFVRLRFSSEGLANLGSCIQLRCLKLISVIYHPDAPLISADLLHLTQLTRLKSLEISALLDSILFDTMLVRFFLFSRRQAVLGANNRILQLQLLRSQHLTHLLLSENVCTGECIVQLPR